MKENQTINCLNNIIIFLNNIDKLNDDIYNQYKLNLLDTFACLIEGINNIKSKNVYNAYNLNEIKKSNKYLPSLHFLRANLFLLMEKRKIKSSSMEWYYF